MCKNIFWKCIFCTTKIRNSAVPEPCNNALTTGYECLPQDQEQWPIPSYSLCPTCKEERRPRRRSIVSVPVPVPVPAGASVPTTVSEMGDPSRTWVNERYIWNWIPTPSTSCEYDDTGVTQPLEQSDERYSRDCVEDEGSHVVGLSRSDTTSYSRQSRITLRRQRGIEDLSTVNGSFRGSRPTSTTESSQNQSSIPVPVHRATQGQRTTGQLGRQRSNIPVYRDTNSSRGAQHLSSMIPIFSPAHASGEGASGSGRSRGIELEVDGFDWEHFDQITF